jgi:ABC-type methionine transport system ATPase subunit
MQSLTTRVVLSCEASSPSTTRISKLRFVEEEHPLTIVLIIHECLYVHKSLCHVTGPPAYIYEVSD